jgi:hypothetical protein
MPSVRVIKKTKPGPLSIRIRQRKSKRWSAWLDKDPSINAGGCTAMAAVGRLLSMHPELFGVVIIPPEEKKAAEKTEI